mmetsp:Transcript_96785/g.273231  ORF Transcript_96785/g.273231 Transcript_96785/m.273231 type:complete len:652 (-) Transcript_96785:58-2013(-)
MVSANATGADGLESRGERGRRQSEARTGSLTVLHPRDGSLDWLRHANDPLSRRLRHAAARETQEAVARGWYLGAAKGRVALQEVQTAEAGTRVISPSASWPSLPPKPKRAAAATASIERADMPASVLSVAAALSQKGRKTAAISAASAYHAGGGFSTGGRHALEEAFCMQSTLYPCLQNVWRNAGAAKGTRYIPQDGAIFSPNVEIWRDSTSAGYAPLDAPVLLACVVSIAMPNLNPRVRDAPTETFSEPRAYNSALCERWRAALHAACLCGVTDVVCPDAGCGVYQNQPAAVGAALSQVLRAEFADRFESVWVVGSAAFFAAVNAPAEAPAAKSAASGLKARILSKKGSKTLSVKSVREDGPEDCPAYASPPASSPSKVPLPLSESNLRRWLSSGFRKQGSKMSTTGSTASSVRSASEMDSDTAVSGTLGGYTASNAGSIAPLADVADLPTLGGVAIRAADAASLHRSWTASPAFGSAGGSVVGSAAAEKVVALLEAAATREDVRLATQGTRAPGAAVKKKRKNSRSSSLGADGVGAHAGGGSPLTLPIESAESGTSFTKSPMALLQANVVQPPSSYNDQPGAELALVSISPRLVCPKPRPPEAQEEDNEEQEEAEEEAWRTWPLPLVPGANLNHCPGRGLVRSGVVISM